MHRSLIEKKVMKFNIDPKIQLENFLFFSQKDNFYPAAILYITSSRRTVYSWVRRSGFMRDSLYKS